jgi:L-fucose isomerase-like protein
LETALATPAAVKVPEGFQERVLAQLPVEASAEMRNCVWTLAAAAVSFAALALRLWCGGEISVLASAVIQYPALLAVPAGIETVLALLWLWRALEASRSMSQ